MAEITFPDGSIQTADDAVVDRLVAKIEDAFGEDGSWWEPLSDRVLDVAAHFGTEAANGVEDEDAQQDALDAASQAGSDVNNAGLRAMLGWLVAFSGVAGAELDVDVIIIAHRGQG